MDRTMIKRVFICFSFAVISPIAAFSAVGPSNIQQSFQSGHVFVEAGLGAVHLKKTKATLVVTQTEHDGLRQNRVSSVPAIDAGIGYAFPVRKGVLNQISLSLNAYAQRAQHTHGNVYQFYMSEPNYRFRMTTQSTRLMANIKANFLKHGRFNPFVLIGVGEAWNRTKSYEETPIAPITLGRYDLKGQRESHVAYQFGLGSDLNLCKNLDGFVQYLYTNMGHYKTGKKDSVHEAVALQKGATFKAREHQLYAGLIYHFN